jgi:hypothetical protein
LVERESGEEIACRVIFVFSTADQKVAQKNREKSVAKTSADSGGHDQGH